MRIKIEEDSNLNTTYYVIEDGVCSMYYTYTDYLGSILKVTDDAGNTVAEQSFDAWGRKRNASNWSYSSISTTPDWLYRGYTGHEHYEEFALINMNGRMYDPTIGRMLSADNFVQNGASTQAYNRYTYAANNPLKYTDPSGEVFGLALGAFLFTGVIAHFSGATSSEVFRIAGTAALTVAVAAGISGAISAGFSGGTNPIVAGAISNFAGGAESGFISSAILSTSNHSNKPIEDALKAAVISGSVSAALGGLSGGFENLSRGQNFLGTKLSDKYLFAYEYTVDNVTGTITKLSDAGGATQHIYNIGTWSDAGTAFQSFNQVIVEGANSINSFRFWESTLATISTFSVPSASLSGYFLEPAGPSTITSNLDRRIPTGSYNLTPNVGSRFPGTYRLYNAQVPKSRAILMHGGNHPDATSGCLLPGGSCFNAPGKYSNWGDNWVGGSSPKLKQLNLMIDKAGHQNVRVNIFNIIR